MMAAEQITMTKSLNDLLSGFCVVDKLVDISGVAIDSRNVQSGDLFLAYSGSQANGVDYIDAAIQVGAVAIAVDEKENIDLSSLTTPVIKVPDLRKQAGLIISRFYDEPSKQLQLIGVTGTNGKSTVSYMIAYALYVLGKQSAVLGTLGYGPIKQIQPGATTTPDPVTLHSLFASWKDSIDSVAMEVSSHALEQGRVAGAAFDMAVFTNLTRDHLDYHETFEAYAAAKFQLFESKGLKHAVINVDDEYGVQLISKLPTSLDIVAYSKKQPVSALNNKALSFVYCKQLETEQLNTTLIIESSWGSASLETCLLGEFNVDNILATFAVLCVSGFPIEKVANALSNFKGIPGRMEYFTAENKPLLIVDYAHTPDALEKALMALRPYCQGQLYCVFGCGGDRDVGKRAEMGSVAERYADYIVITNDNPRSEVPESITTEILKGIRNQDIVTIKHDRSDAITNTFLNANSEDVVLVAGKGHETTQQIGEALFPFSDRELARRLTEKET